MSGIIHPLPLGVSMAVAEQFFLLFTKVLNIEIISHKYNVVAIPICRNYAQKWIINLVASAY
jgi:hypothetical protein